MAEAGWPQIPGWGGFAAGSPEPTPEEKAERARNCLTDWRVGKFCPPEFNAAKYGEILDWRWTWLRRIEPHACGYRKRYETFLETHAPRQLRSVMGTDSAASPKPPMFPPREDGTKEVWLHAESLRVLDAVFRRDLKDVADIRYRSLRIAGEFRLAYAETELYWRQRLENLGYEGWPVWEKIKAHGPAARQLSAKCVALVERRYERAESYMREFGGADLRDYIQAWTEHSLLVRGVDQWCGSR